MSPRAVGSLQDVIDALAPVIPESPLEVAAIFVALVLVLAGLRWLVDYLRSTPAELLRETLAGHDRVSVLMHPNPDPDAMSSALAVGELAETVDTEATLNYPGQIRHQENRAFETVLDVDFEQIDSAGELDGDAVVLVDHNEARGFPGAEGVDPVAVIDHHPGDGEGAEFTDVRADHGACATIFAEYFETLGWEPEKPGADENGDDSGEDDGDGLPTQLATGLLYGIQSDTKQLTKGCSPAEFHAAEYLYAGIDEDRLDRIANPQVDAEVLDVKARAITSRTVRNAFAVSDVGEVSNVDAIPQAADELMKLEGVTAVVVLGEKDGTLHLSGRSRDDRVHMGKVLDSVVDDIPMGTAGGHARMGGGQLSIEHMEGIGPSEGVLRQDFTERLFDAMSGDI
ncbi:nanoRNase/pAp phosphatase, hydrolyzes c-di-AMP and oligoRNAs [Halomicrobium zhouii]|uniref:NanoRNase/pAp phosphatase, hydrolyzes c-di-AMP and oligoRNAs n=1 Tax=Halomicrobium zhouii TaxID=767519 RepID=A0A1I6LER5_9EURY|nr:DHHA1 domain-containing protein [Halomicrobium zhouii]SFS01939.1 nanoRNase/pAp phosphatase, hydrolyzes c-di-AMP and oligoRNAs [Halomicrobium zhouii]